MDYETAVHEAGHAVAADYLGVTWELHAEGNDEYEAFVRVFDYKDKDDATFIRLCGPYAEAGLGEVISEDYHWDHIKGAPRFIKDYHESKAQQFIYENWSKVIKLADEFVVT